MDDRRALYDELPERWPVGAQAADDGVVLVTTSEDSILIEDRLVPEWINVLIRGDVDRPKCMVRIEIRRSTPECVSLVFVSEPGQREIRQSDLRPPALDIQAFVIDMVAAMSIHVDMTDPEETVFRAGLPGEDGPGEVYNKARRFVERRRRGPGLRDITDELLQQVADVYRENIDRAPTQAVAKRFGVQSRMASTYVQRARAKGFLPPTKQGQKKA